MGDLHDAREDRRRAQQGHAVPDAGGPRRLLRRDPARPPIRSARPSRWTPSTRCTSSTPPARPPSRRASCTPPAATSPGVSATHRYVFDLKPESRTSTGAPPTSAGSPGTPTSSTGRCANGATSVMWEGAPDYPNKGIWWEIVERYGVTILYCAPDRDPRVHQVGRAVAERARPLLAAAAGHGGRADQPEGVALVPQGDRRRTLPDRGHLVADRDGRDHDHAAAGHHRHQARLGHAALPGGGGRGAATSPPASRSRRARGCSC